MKNKRILKYGLNSAVIIIGTIIAIILLNSILISFDDKMSLEVDLTKDEIYRLSDETKEVIEKIDKETKIVLFYDGSYETNATYKDQMEKDMNLIRSVVEKYTEENNKIKFETLDYYKNPTVILENPIYSNVVFDIHSRGLNPMLSMAFVQGEEYEIADYSTYYEQVYNEESKEIESQSNLENVLTNKLRSLSGESEGFTKVLLTNGHGEKNTEQMLTLLSKYNYEWGNIDLISEDIPKDEKVLLIIDSPSNDFTESEILKLDDFLKFGGNAQIYFNPLTSNNELSRLESYLADTWGIIRNHGVTTDTPNNIGASKENGYVMAIGEYAEHDIVKGFSDARVMYTSSNPLQIKNDKEGSITVEPVLTTSENAVLKTVETATEPANAGDAKGKYNIILTSTKNHYDIYNNMTTGKVLVCGSSYAMDVLSSEKDCLNEDLLINSFNWMSGNGTDIDVGTKELPEGGLVITNASKWGWFSVLVVIIPVAVLAAGFVMFIKRRYK